jgi:hypothetical protein
MSVQTLEGPDPVVVRHMIVSSSCCRGKSYEAKCVKATVERPQLKGRKLWPNRRKVVCTAGMYACMYSGCSGTSDVACGNAGGCSGTSDVACGNAAGNQLACKIGA